MSPSGFGGAEGAGAPHAATRKASASGTVDQTWRTILELRDTRTGAVLVLLGRSAARSARAFDDAIADDWHRALARDHVPALRRHDVLDDGAAGALGKLSTGTPEGDRRDRFALGAVGAGPDRSVHPIEGDQAPARIADGRADLDVQLFGLVERPLHDPVRFRERESHVEPPVRVGERPRRYEAGTVRCASSSKYSGKVLATQAGFSITTGSPPHAARENAIAMRWSL